MNIVFNGIVSHLIALKTLKSQKELGLCPLKPHQGSVPDPIYEYYHQLFPYKTQSSSRNKTLVKVLG